MKTIRFFAALVLFLSILSCQKEEQLVVDNSGNEGGTLITCTFASNDATSKTTLNGMTPNWVDGDEIMIYDGSSSFQKLTLATSGEASSSKGIIDGTDAKKFAFEKPTGWDNVYAIYPYSACVSGFSASNPKLSFAGQDGTFAKANICAAKTSTTTMSFKNVAAIFKFPSKPETVTGLEIQLAGLANDYTVSFSETNPSLASASASNSRSYSIGNGTGEIYIAIPGGESIAKNTVFIYKGSNSNILGSYLIKTATSTASNKIYTLPAIVANGMLPGLFTVDENKQVRFSKGNLWCDNADTPAWYFEANQYDYQDSYNSTWENNNHISHFYWSQTASNAYSALQKTGSYTDILFTNDASTTPKSDFTVNNQTAVWRSLSALEWQYIIKNRTNAASKYGYATVAEKTGLIILPDTFTDPNKNGGSGAFVPSTTDSKAFTNNVYTSGGNWEAMEGAGAVFLPAAGQRSSNVIESLGAVGGCWSSTPPYISGYDSFAYRLFFNLSGVSTGANTRSPALSIRLVRDAE